MTQCTHLKHLKISNLHLSKPYMQILLSVGSSGPNHAGSYCSCLLWLGPHHNPAGVVPTNLFVVNLTVQIQMLVKEKKKVSLL